MSELVNDRQKKVLDMMTRLNDLAREVIVMHYIEQESYEQIAQRLGKKPQHIRSISAKAITRLRQLISRAGHARHFEF